MRALPARAIFLIMEGADLLDLVDLRKGACEARVGSMSMDVLLGKIEDIAYGICAAVYSELYTMQDEGCWA